MRVLLFAGRDCPSDFAAAEACRRVFSAHSVPVRIVDRLDSSLEAVLLLARYGIVEPRVLVVVDDAGQVLARRLTFAPTEVLADLALIGAAR